MESDAKTVAQYLAELSPDRCAHDPPPGTMVMWRGLSKLNDIHLGFLLGTKTYG